MPIDLNEGEFPMNKINRSVLWFTGLALLSALVIVSFWTFRQIEETANMRMHNYTVLQSGDALLFALIDAETSERGYLLTGDKAFLEPYLLVNNRISNKFDALRQLTLISEAQKHLDELAPLIDAKLALMASNIELFHNNKMSDIQADILSGQGKRLMDSIRAEMNSFIQLEKYALEQHETKFQSNMRNMFIIIFTMSLLTLLFSLFFAYLIYRERQYRLKDLIYAETKYLLEIQEKINGELQLANDTLQISEEKLTVTLNSISDGVIATDAEGHVTLMNPLAELLTGWTQAEAAGRPIDDIFNIINKEHPLTNINPLKENLAHHTINGTGKQTVLIARNGSEFVIADGCHATPIRNYNNQVIGSVLVFRDITSQIDMELGLEKTLKDLSIIKASADETSEFAESIINTVREPLIALDQDLRVVTVSRSFYEVFKVNPEETVGHLIYDLGNKQWNIPKLRELLETILPQKTTFDNYEVEHDFTTIGRRIMLLNARQIQRVLGKERIILLAIEDITDRREIENGLKKAHEELKELATELKRTALVKSEFLANMSHELRTPLNSINGFSEVLYDETFGPLNEKQKKYVYNVLTSGKHLLLLINQILDMAKVEAGKMKLSLTILPMNSLLNELSLLIADLVSKKKLQMMLEIAEDLPNIEGDELKVKEIIYNLLSNAVKFTPEGGTIGMRAKKFDDFSIEIIVWDTGCGIALENIGKIFEGFFRVDTPYSRVIEGTGLGLPISRKLVELHNGQLVLVSDGLNKGTKVRFTLPIISGNGAYDE